MFDDIRRANGDAKGVAIVKVRDENRAVDAVQYALTIAQAESSEVVNWLDVEQSAAFLEERRRIAMPAWLRGQRTDRQPTAM